jgi:hypothetical protein
VDRPAPTSGAQVQIPIRRQSAPWFRSCASGQEQSDEAVRQIARYDREEFDG